MIIALAGKGGVGKSSISSQLILQLSKKGLVLAVDADPNTNLPDKLGIPVEVTIGEIRNRTVRDPDKIPGGMSKHEYVALEVRRAMHEHDNIDLLVMGRPEGEGCYCFMNNVLKECFGDMIKKYRFTVIDNEAGMEHLSRKILPRADVMLFVSDPTRIGIRTASRLSSVASEVGMEIGRRILVINNLPGELPQELSDEAKANGFDEVAVIKHDLLVYSAGLEGSALRLPDGSELSKGVSGILKMII
ncbi:MAG: AAA family ATPase [Methanomassiliicoccaceae archaeon]|jgi:CO dehydrogenase maturation factor|nr:AAA family ATPase [Methanomassiliicoccaceae archaeon]